MRNRKVRPGNKIARMLTEAQGAPVSVNSIREMMENDPLLAPTIYKLSGYVRDIFVYDGGITKAIKNGREVLAYSLTNFFEFDHVTGFRYRGDALTAAQKAYHDKINAALNAEHVALTGEPLPGYVAPSEATAEPIEESVGASRDAEPVAETVTEEVPEPVIEEDPIISPEMTEEVTEPSMEEPVGEETPTQKPTRTRDSKGHFLKAA